MNCGTVFLSAVKDLQGAEVGGEVVLEDVAVVRGCLVQDGETLGLKIGSFKKGGRRVVVEDLAEGWSEKRRCLGRVSDQRPEVGFSSCRGSEYRMGAEWFYFCGDVVGGAVGARSGIGEVDGAGKRIAGRAGGDAQGFEVRGAAVLTGQWPA